MAGKPDYRVKALNKNTEEKGELGVAWKNPEGHITIVFNPFVVVPTGKDFVITMFPNTPFPGSSKQGEQEEIPF